jgi:hypothetical protein
MVSSDELIGTTEYLTLYRQGVAKNYLVITGFDCISLSNTSSYFTHIPILWRLQAVIYCQKAATETIRSQVKRTEPSKTVPGVEKIFTGNKPRKKMHQMLVKMHHTFRISERPMHNARTIHTRHSTL